MVISYLKGVANETWYMGSPTSPMKFERHQLYGFSNMEVQNIGLFAIFNVPQTVSTPIT